MSTRWITLAAAFVPFAINTSASAQANGISCPEAPVQTARDWSVDTQGTVAGLGKLKAGELANQTHVVTKPLFDNVPNSDRFLLAQSLISLFCKTIANSSLPDKEKLDRVQAFTDQIMSLWLGARNPASNSDRTGASNAPGRSSTRAGSPATSAEDTATTSDPTGAARLHSARNPQALKTLPKGPTDLEKYIDSSAHGSEDKKNVAVTVLEYADMDVSPLQDAAQRALRERGYNVLPLFRASFSKDEIGRTLFTGSSAVATRLELRKHCDTVLLGRLRLVGTVSNVNGLYISEWALAIRAISPETGSVTDEMELHEKGGGTTPAASKADAIRRLEQSVELQLTQWSWT